MTQHYYVYRSFEEGGRDYIGRRACKCLPEEDTNYLGSFTDKTFKPTGKVILFVCETPEEVAEIEIELHDFFDVGVNPQFANRSKQTSTRFDRTGVSLGPNTEEQKRKISVANFGKTRTEEQKEIYSKAKSGKNNPMYGVTRKAHSERMSGENNPNYGNTGALSSCSKAIIAIKPDGLELHYGSIIDAAKELGISKSNLSHRYLKPGKSPTQGKFKGWWFIYDKSTECL